MTDSAIQKLAEEFRKFPGIGPRQAQRFVYYLLRTSSANIESLVRQIKELRSGVAQCRDCCRYFAREGNGQTVARCSICADETRDKNILMIVEKDIDLDNVERSDTYNGHYFVLGSLIPVLDKSPELRIRGVELAKRVEGCLKNGLQEIILALSANTEGDYTADFVHKYLLSKLSPTISKLKVSRLGRGLSTGTELEYSDADTIKNALKHRE